MQPLSVTSHAPLKTGASEVENSYQNWLHLPKTKQLKLVAAAANFIVAEVRKSASQPDWYKKDDTKAQLQLAVKRVLRGKV